MRTDEPALRHRLQPELRHRVLRALGVLDDDEPDEPTRALLTAMALIDDERRGVALRAKWDPAKHPRILKGQPGGGRFLSMVERIKAKLDRHLDGDGDGDPFDGFSREQLRRAAKARGITLKRGAPREDIAAALLADLGGRAGNAPKTPAPKKRTPVPAGARPYHRSVDDVADLARAVERGRLVDERELTGGAVGDVRLRTYEDGTQVVYKRVAKGGTRGDRSMADSEQLAALVAQRLGLAAPRVYRNSDDELHMDYVDATVGDKYLGVGAARLARLEGVVGSPGGRMMGLLDVLTDQVDRHNGNWMITADGRLVPLDNGGWWPDYDDPYTTPQDAPNLLSTFTDSLIVPLYSSAETSQWRDNDLSRADLAVIREQLSGLAPDFEHLGRSEWFDYMMARLDEVERHATGTTSHLLPER